MRASKINQDRVKEILTIKLLQDFPNYKAGEEIEVFADKMQLDPSKIQVYHYSSWHGRHPSFFCSGTPEELHEKMEIVGSNFEQSN